MMALPRSAWHIRVVVCSKGSRSCKKKLLPLYTTDVNYFLQVEEEEEHSVYVLLGFFVSLMTVKLSTQSGDEIRGYSALGFVLFTALHERDDCTFCTFGTF